MLIIVYNNNKIYIINKINQGYNIIDLASVSEVHDYHVTIHVTSLQKRA